jgi:hypothetical protein
LTVQIKEKLNKNDDKLQELLDLIKMPNLEGGAEIQTKGTENLFKEIAAENFSNLGKDMYIQVVQKAFKTSSRYDHKRNFPSYIMVKIPKLHNKEVVLKAAREK